MESNKQQFKATDSSIDGGQLHIMIKLTFEKNLDLFDKNDNGDYLLPILQKMQDNFIKKIESLGFKNSTGITNTNEIANIKTTGLINLDGTYGK
jgi:hypothetical protein